MSIGVAGAAHSPGEVGGVAAHGGPDARGVPAAAGQEDQRLVAPLTAGCRLFTHCVIGVAKGVIGMSVHDVMLPN
jgi:hypothetical protein